MSSYLERRAHHSECKKNIKITDGGLFTDCQDVGPKCCCLLGLEKNIDMKNMRKIRFFFFFWSCTSSHDESNFSPHRVFYERLLKRIKNKEMVYMDQNKEMVFILKVNYYYYFNVSRSPLEAERT